MTAPTARDVVHKVNNLIATIYTQAAVAREAEAEQNRRAWDLVEQAAKETAELVSRFRKELGE